MVLDLDLDAESLHGQDHLGAQVLVLVHGRDREVALLVPGLVAEVLAPSSRPVFQLLRSSRPNARRVLVVVEPDVVEDEELRLRPEVGRVGEAGRHQVVLRLLRHVARVAGVRLEGDRVVHEAVDVERLVLAERIDDGRVRVGHEDHVGLLDLLEAPDRRAVEPESLLEAVGAQLVRRHREVLHQARQVTEPEIDDLDALVPGQARTSSGVRSCTGCSFAMRTGAS